MRHWRWIFGREGTAGLRARKAPGPAPVKAQAALSVIEEVLAPAVSERPKLDLATPGRGDRTANRAADFDIAPQRGDEKGGFAWRRPRHTLSGRQDAEAVDRSGLRLRLLRQQAEAGDIVLLFGDESEALTHPISPAPGPSGERICGSRRPARRASGR